MSINQLHILHSPASRSLVDAWLGIDSADLTASQLQPLRVEALRRFLLSQSAPVYFKAHEACRQPQCDVSIVPAGFDNRVVYVVRDPRDVALSYAEFAGLQVDDAIDWLCDCGQWLPDYTEGVSYELPVWIGSWSDHLDCWTQAPQTLLIRYEDMQENPRRSFAAILEHLGIAIDSARLDCAIASSSFDRAVAQERSEGFIEAMPGRRFFGHGAVGRWRQALSTAQARRVAAHHARWMDQLNYQ